MQIWIKTNVRHNIKIYKAQFMHKIWDNTNQNICEISSETA